MLNHWKHSKYWKLYVFYISQNFHSKAYILFNEFIEKILFCLKL